MCKKHSGLSVGHVDKGRTEVGLVRIRMSRDVRTCRSCGAEIPAGVRECPNCGRLSIDRRAARLGAAPEAPAPPPSLEQEQAVTEEVREPVEEATASADESEDEPPEDEPDSFFSIAPRYEEPTHEETPAEEGAPREEGPRCGGCAVFVVLLYWLLALSVVL